MGTPSIMAAPNWSDLFRQAIFTNLEYWQDWIKTNTANVDTLEREQQSIVRAIGYALELEATWPAVAELVISFSTFMERWGHWDIWTQVLERAIVVARSKDDTTHQITLTAILARLLFQQSRFKESVRYYRQTIRMARQIRDQFNEARACTNLGYLYIEGGYWQRAEVLCCYALKLFDQMNSNHGRAHTENHLGFLYTRQCLWDKARQHLERACSIWQSSGDNHGLMRGLINLGVLYCAMECPDEAVLYLERALQLAESTGEEAEIGTIYLNLGFAYKQNGELVQAERYVGQAEVNFRHFSNSSYLTLAWASLGSIYLEQKKWRAAKRHLKTALQVSRDLKYKHGQLEALLGLAAYELARGNQYHAKEKLAEVESIIQSEAGGSRYRLQQMQLLNYRRSLAGASGQTAAE